ncbi:hypothetical protein FSP39_018789 [Pinctada imbricata]|uniref:Uncharacterized protein n=1 Tax=Pinctada imbricata TaxID=66713 RepID=A0AA88XT81_PINIB|nr:hypothetical protein FSP39_018789 [Pinctada imbricata]
MSVITDENKNRGGGSNPPPTVELGNLRLSNSPGAKNRRDMDNNNIKMGSLQELHAMIKDKDEKIRKLQKQVQEKDDEIANLRSQLDKYQSVLPQSLKATTGGRRKQRAQGISAEPRGALSSIQDLANTKFKKHSKSER